MVRKTAIIFLIVFIILGLNFTAFTAGGGELNGDRITIIEKEEITEVEAEGNVTFIYNDLEVRGDFARYNLDQKDIMFKGNIRMTSEDYLLQGESLEGNLDESVYRISEECRVTGTDLDLKSDLLVYDRKTDTITAEKTDSDVVPEFTYQEISARADKIIYSLKEEKVLLTGNVQGSRDEQTFKAEELTIDLSGKEIRLSGQARLVIPDGGE